MEVNRVSLAAPLSSLQIQAASRLHRRLKRWIATDTALAALSEHFPDFGLKAVLLKVPTVNQFYGTNLRAVLRMADHIVKIMAETDPATAGPELVERLAMLPTASEEEKQRTFLSFASKFAHFFIDAERFPIYDSYAVKMVEYHLGLSSTTWEKSHPYQTFVTHLNNLKLLAALSCTSRELDHYLWLAGLYRAWLKNPEAKINADATQLFAQSSDEIQADLAQLLSPTPVYAVIGER